MSDTHYVYYNETGIIHHSDKPNSTLDNNKLWIDITNPNDEDLEILKTIFDLDIDIVQLIKQKTKRPQVRILNEYIFSIILDIRYKTRKNLLMEGVYSVRGKDWLITLHSAEVELLDPIMHTIERRNRKILESSIDALYYTLIDEIIGRYEQLLTSIEITINDYEQESLLKTKSKRMLVHLDKITREIIILRRQFWYTRNVINHLLHLQDRSKDIKYLEIASQNITQIIDLIESYGDTINSTRDLYLANISLQLNDTMRILTIFSVILLPLTLITGIYGMNGFDLSKMNEVPSGFIILGILMLIIAILLLVFFKQKKWVFVKDIDQSSSFAIESAKKD